MMARRTSWHYLSVELIKKGDGYGRKECGTENRKRVKVKTRMMKK